MTKRQTIKEDLGFDELEKTYPNHEFLDKITLGRLVRSNYFPYSHQNRLHKEVSIKVIKTFSDITDFYHYLPESYQREILASKAFENLTYATVDALKNQLHRKTDKRKQTPSDKKIVKENYSTLYRLYATFFNVGIYGIIDLMPSEFQNQLNDQVKPIIDLMRSIEEYTKRLKPSRTNMEYVGIEPYKIGA